MRGREGHISVSKGGCVYRVANFETIKNLLRIFNFIDHIQRISYPSARLRQAAGYEPRENQIENIIVIITIGWQFIKYI